MKNKKLFAILTLVCFMFTLMPVAAFAADTYVEVSKDGGTTWEDSVTVEVNDTVNVNVVNGGAGLFAVDEDGELDQITTASTISFDEEGTYKIYATDASLASALAAETKMLKADKLELLMESDNLVEDYATVKVKSGDVDYRIVLADDNETGKTVYFNEDTRGVEYSMTIVANEGWNEDGNVKATLQKTSVATPAEADWADVKGAELTFTKAGYVDVVCDDATTDRGGDVEFEVVSDRAGSYTMYVKYGTDAKVKLNVTVTTSTVADVAVQQAPTAPVNIDQTIQAADIEFKFVDANNGAYNTLASGDYKITVVDQPADSDMDGDDFGFAKESEDGAGIYTLTGANGTTKFEEEGTYEIKVTLENGESAVATVKVAEQGDITAIKFDVWNTPRTVAYGGTTMVNAVQAVDANGVTSNLAISDGLKLSASGLAIDNFSNGVLKAKNDPDYIGATITVMAVYDDFVATTVLTVVDEAAQIVYDKTTAEVGITTTMLGTITDSTGKNSALGAAAATATPQAIVLEKPANAIAVATVDTTLDAKGRVVLNFLASEEGEYKVQTIVTYNAGTVAEPVIKYISAIETITVGAGEGTFEDVVVMSIGANKIVVNSEVKDLVAAPMIKDARTFVPFRALAEAFGADVEWVEATQSVVAELNGVKVVMNIGEEVYTVNGVEKTADVAPFINGASTMVPVRFVAEAFGITVTPIYAEDGSVADVLFAK